MYVTRKNKKTSETHTLVWFGKNTLKNYIDNKIAHTLCQQRFSNEFKWRFYVERNIVLHAEHLIRNIKQFNKCYANDNCTESTTFDQYVYVCYILCSCLLCFVEINNCLAVDYVFGFHPNVISNHWNSIKNLCLCAYGPFGYRFILVKYTRRYFATHE